MTELATHFRGHGGVKEVMTELAADFGGHQKMHICSREAVVVSLESEK